MIDKLISKHLNEAKSCNVKKRKRIRKIHESSEKIFYWGRLPNYEREDEPTDASLVVLKGVDNMDLFDSELEVEEVMFGWYEEGDKIPYGEIIPALNEEEDGEFFTNSEKKMKELMKKYIDKEIKMWVNLKRGVNHDLKG